MKQRQQAGRDGDEGQARLAVLIDADNAQPSVIEGLLAEVARFGVASVKRIYGDFTSTRMTQWKAVLLKYSINPVQQFAYTSGKNATDSSLIIDAMDLMYTGRFDGVCLVSSDSDFTRLAQRMREEGLLVYGFGEQKTPDAFVQACDKFIYTEVLRAEVEPAKATPARSGRGKAPAKAAARAAAPRAGGATSPATTTAAPSARQAASAGAMAGAGDAASSSADAVADAPPQRKAAVQPLPLQLLRRAIEEASDEQGWAHLGAVGTYLTKIRPDFDPRLYGHRKLSDLVKHHPRHFKLEERGSSGGGKAIYVCALE